jgi:hypothetical protein
MWVNKVQKILGSTDPIKGTPILDGGSDSLIYAFDHNAQPYITRVFAKDRPAWD